MKKDIIKIIQDIIRERYNNAKAAFFAGSVAQDIGTDSSDLDIVIVFESLPNAYREAFIYNDWPIDVFIHDINSLNYFCKEIEYNDGSPALINMVMCGVEILNINEYSERAKQIARTAYDLGPKKWDQAIINKERFIITDILDDLKSPRSKEEQIISAIHLFEPLIQFYFRAQGKWSASGKTLMQIFKTENNYIATKLNKSFENLIKTGDASEI